jgi:LysM repeat protein
VKTPPPAATPLVNGTGSGTYKVKPGDALSKIAKQYGTTTAELRKLNNLSSDSIRVDQTLKLPGGSATASASPSVAVLDIGTKVPALAAAAPSGAKKVSPSDIESILGPDPASRAPTGTAARIEEVLEADSPDEPAAPARDTSGLGGITLKPTEYKILPGDTVGKLAVIFLSSEAEIRRLNGLGPSQEVKAGDTILIPPPKDP